MEKRLSVVVVLARCRHTKEYFGIRFEESKGLAQGSGFGFGLNPKRIWVTDWAFEIANEMGKKERYDKTEIEGIIGMAITYPGCPHCNGKSIFKCGCGKVACWDAETKVVTCPHCGMLARLSGQIESLNSGVDR